MNIKKLKDHKYAQCHIKSDVNTILLVSYRTPVILCTRINDTSYKIYCSGTYSATTRKHIGYFLKEYFPSISYYDIKKIAYTDNYIIGECVCL